MAWNEDLVIMLRAEIGDLDATTYSDSRLRQVLVYAAYSVYQSAHFTTVYTVSVSELSISPDPVTTNDYDFSILTVYKAACIISKGEARDKGSGSVLIKDGPSTFDNRGAGTNLMGLMKTVCQTYTDLLYQFQLLGDAQGGPGLAVLSPYSPGSFLTSWSRGEGRSGNYY